MQCGLANIHKQSLVCAICQNIKKSALVIGGRMKNRLVMLLNALFPLAELCAA
jgi:hypothetical protein